MASGQHRVAALRKMHKSYLDDEITLSKRLNQLRNLKATEELLQEHAAVQNELAKVKGLISHNGEWGVILYDIGEQAVCGSRTESGCADPMTGGRDEGRKKDILLADGFDLAHHLSRNESLHVYKETLEEVLVTTLRNFSDEYQRGGEPAVQDALELVFSKPTKEKNSKITRILKDTRLTMTLIKDLLPMGPYYRKRREFSVGWLAKSLSVTMGMYTIYMLTGMDTFRLLASKDEFPTHKKIVNLEAASTVDDEAGQHALRSLAVLHDTIMNSTPGDPTIFVPYITDIEEAASTNFRSYKGTWGMWDVGYMSSLKQYRQGVHTALHNRWFFHSRRSKKDLPWFDRVLARTWVWLMPIPEVRMPMPLMTSTAMDKAHKELEAVKAGYTEVSRSYGTIRK
ncbi:hypothetical protein BDR05DRAFT_952349 [Suillus weaverae]|nr:hypothetical protein BDR05DRAFT_952349 [Suillus weaverae]